jgi:hypothetical protein
MQEAEFLPRKAAGARTAMDAAKPAGAGRAPGPRRRTGGRRGSCPIRIVPGKYLKVGA